MTLVDQRLARCGYLPVLAGCSCQAATSLDGCGMTVTWVDRAYWNWSLAAYTCAIGTSLVMAVRTYRRYRPR
jgi:hypothetical protein